MKSLLSRAYWMMLIMLMPLMVNAAGIPNQAEGFATTGINPRLTIVVTDSNGIGVGGVPLSVSITAGSGILDLSNVTTDAGGTTQVSVSNAALGDKINIYCLNGNVLTANGKSNTITVSSARAVQASDMVLAWFDEPRHTVNAAVVDPGTLVMVTTNAGSIDNDDIDNNGDNDTKRLTFANIIMQDPAVCPYSREVYQGTYDSNNQININVDEISGDPDASISLVSLSNTWDPVLETYSKLLNAYAVSGANPEVVASVIDREGRGIAGVTITAQCSAGIMTPASALTDDNGLAVFNQSGGTLGDAIIIACNLAETLPVEITTENSVPINSSSKVFSWYEKKTRAIHTAIVDRNTNVLVQNSADLRRDVDELSVDNIYPYPGNFVEQTSQRPASSYVVYGGSEAGDLIRIYHYGTIYRYPGGATYNSGLYANSVITMPPDEERYLMACAAGGTSPKVWAMVADKNGNAVKNIPINYSLSGSGVLDYGNTITVWSGIAYNKITGGALGDTLTVSSAGLGDVKIYLSNGQSPGSTDRVYGLYDPETHNAFGVVVQSANNIMTDTFGQGNFRGYDELDQTSGNGINASLSYYFYPQNENRLCEGYAGYGTIGEGDILRLQSTYTSPTYDIYIRAGGDPDEFLLAFAMPGDRPEIWAVAMDKYGNGVANKQINFSSTAGTLSLTNGQTNGGGFVVSQATTVIGYGNTITVSSPGMPPVSIWPSAGSNYTGADRSFMWYDPTTLLLRNVTVEMESNLATNNDALSTSNLQVVDNSDNNKTIVRGETFDQAGSASPPRIGIGYIVFNTAGIGDVIHANFGTSNDIESYITIKSINSQFLQAYAESGSSTNIVAVVTDADGNAIPDVTVNFSSSQGTLPAPPPGGFKTDINGMVKTSYNEQSGYGEKIEVSTPDFTAAPVTVITYNQDTVQTYYRAIPFYNRFERKLNVAYVHEYFNTVPNQSFAIESILTHDYSDNQKSISVGPISNHSSNAPAVAYLAPATGGSGDQLEVNDTTVDGSPDALVTLGTEVDKYLYAFGTGGPLPVTVTAVVVDKEGLGLGGETVVFTPSGGGSMSLTETVTDDDGEAMAYFQGAAPLGSAVTIAAPNSVTYTAVVTTANSVGDSNDSRVFSWFAFLSQKAKAAVVSLNNIMTSTGTVNFTAQDMTPNGKTFTLINTIQQTADAPAEVSVVNGTQGGGDLIKIEENTTIADPDGYVKVDVPFSEMASTLTASPDPVLTNQNITVTMGVYNVGGPDALSVSPTALAVAGNATYLSGPSPSFYASIPGGGHEDFSWTYQATSPGGVTFTGQAFGVDSFTMAGLTSTATDSNPVLIRNPDRPHLTTTMAAAAGTVSTGQPIDVTMTVTNDSSSDVPQALTVTPNTLTVLGGAAYAGGPVPATQLIGRGETKGFSWTYTAGAPGHVTVTGQAYSNDPFDAAGVTSNASSTVITVQSPAHLTCSLEGPDNAERLRDFTLTMRVTNTGQANALLARPVNLGWSGTGSATVETMGSTTPASATIAGGGSQDFTWLVTVGPEVGALTFTGQAQAVDLNSGNTVTAASATSNDIHVIQGAINLDRVSSSAGRVYQGQKAIPVTMEARNTSLMSVTITAANLTFNHSQTGFTVISAPDNPNVVGPQSSFTLEFYVDIGKEAPLGAVTVDGTISGDAETGAMAANGAQSGTAQWTVLKPVNSMRQNYPNPLKLSQQGYTTFDYYVAKDEDVSIKMYNLAGELVAVVVDGKPGVGAHQAKWYGDNGTPGKRGRTVGSGVYMAVYRIGSYREIKKVVVIR